MILNDNFTNIKGKYFEGVKELAFTKENLYGNIDKFVNEDYNLLNGVYIYKDFNNKNIGYKIYKEFMAYKFNGYRDDELIYNLIQRSKNIKLTEMPIGVVTIDGKIIG